MSFRRDLKKLENQQKRAGSHIGHAGHAVLFGFLAGVLILSVIASYLINASVGQ